MRIAEIAIPRPLDRTFDYEVPPALAGAVMPGARVRVPFGPRAGLTGFVMAVRDGEPAMPLKSVAAAPDPAPLLLPEQVELALWLSRRYCAPIGDCLKSMVPANLREARRPQVVPAPAAAAAPGPHPPCAFELTPGQKQALDTLGRALEARTFSAALLYGVPASGKTEVYARLIRQAAAGGGQALFLVPEISLTAPFFEEFAATVGLPVALWHSRIGAKSRREIWLGLRSGALRVIVGARSAALLPFCALRLAVLDEEQDESYKQDDQAPHYHARDVVLRRARACGAVVLLGSATPSIETFAMAQSGEISLVRMDERVSKTTGRPAVRILERAAGAGQCISPELVRGIRERLALREQVILIVNRRGFSNFLICRKCGWVARCPECSVAFIHHRRQRAAGPAGLFDDTGEFYLRCHHCGRSSEVPGQCGRCRGLELRLAGIGTQKVVSELKMLVPEARVLRLDGDTVEEEAKAESSIYRQFHAGKADVLVGTKLAAKGFHFPRVTLVGIVDADTMLSMPDFRAAERTVQLLVQAAGRAGRADRPGTVLLQTAQPTHYAIQSVARGDYAAFAQREIAMRGELQYPPASTLVRLLFVGRNESATAKAAAAGAEALRAVLDARDEVLGPAPGVHVQMGGLFRHHLLMKIMDASRVEGAIAAVRALELPSTVRVKVNVDPYDFF
ncbi:MAG: primosomal protein N' [Elusimicrobia bacterium GWA2_69_24]|nr:MAG: primosomal protein N' [Elusimicrobia bacterium GWA2_69_24]HBL18789.1 primosomal protein N' [Elusimicrobiota bacterium]